MGIGLSYFCGRVRRPSQRDPVNNEAARLTTGGIRDFTPGGRIHFQSPLDTVLIFYEEIYCFTILKRANLNILIVG